MKLKNTLIIILLIQFALYSSVKAQDSTAVSSPVTFFLTVMIAILHLSDRNFLLFHLFVSPNWLMFISLLLTQIQVAEVTNIF